MTDDTRAAYRAKRLRDLEDAESNVRYLKSKADATSVPMELTRWEVAAWEIAQELGFPPWDGSVVPMSEDEKAAIVANVLAATSTTVAPGRRFAASSGSG